VTEQPERSSSSAATEESTPPLRPRTTWGAREEEREEEEEKERLRWLGRLSRALLAAQREQERMLKRTTCLITSAYMGGQATNMMHSLPVAGWQSAAVPG
jgi:hypothetical protein